jgi:ABC-type Mn2+/Zn2+ transport system ATPase subunit
VAIQRLIKSGVTHEPAPTLDVDHVWATYGAKVGAHNGDGPRYALEDITFQVQPGQRVAIVGPNGAGKSTLFRIIAGTLTPDKGTVNIFGHDPNGHICIAYVPQRSQIDWTFPVTVEEVVMMGRVGQIRLLRWPGRRDWDVVHESLSRVGATDLARTQIGELSGGQQQRVFLARALAQEAELLLLDEPLNGLDIPTQEAIIGILDDLRADGVTVLLATHDLDLAAERFDAIMLLNHRIIAYAPPAEALRPENLLTAYGGHIHRLNDAEGTLFVADTCCSDDEA